MARLFDQTTGKWTEPPHGLACRCERDWKWPSNSATSCADLESVQCVMRGNSSINDYDEPRMICLESLVLSSEWILTKHASGLTVRGSPVSRSLGSPLVVILETPSAVFVSGAAMETELVNPERYKRGKNACLF